MSEEKRGPVYTQIRNLLAVLTLGIGCAVVLAGLFLFYYGPTGIYVLKNVMVSPHLMDGLSYADQNPTTGKVTRYTFEKVEFSYWLEEKRLWVKQPLSLESYNHIYDTLSNDKSLADVSDVVVQQFQKAPPAKIMVYVKQAGDAGGASLNLFQEVQFAEAGDHYRVELHEQQSLGNWAYFYHPQVYQKVMSAFTSQPGVP